MLPSQEADRHQSLPYCRFFDGFVTHPEARITECSELLHCKTLRPGGPENSATQTAICQQTASNTKKSKIQRKSAKPSENVWGAYSSALETKEATWAAQGLGERPGKSRRVKESRAESGRVEGIEGRSFARRGGESSRSAPQPGRAEQSRAESGRVGGSRERESQRAQMPPRGPQECTGAKRKRTSRSVMIFGNFLRFGLIQACETKSADALPPARES